MLHLAPGIFGCRARVIIKALISACRTKQNAGPGRRALLLTVLTVTLLTPQALTAPILTVLTHQALTLHIPIPLILPAHIVPILTARIHQAHILPILILRRRARKSRFGILTV